jgi:hypothetical protein
VTALVPEGPQRPRQTGGEVDVAVLERAPERRLQVVVFPLQPDEPAALIGAGEMWLRLLRQRHEALHLPVLEELVLTGLLQALAGVQPYRLEEEATCRAVLLLHDHQRLVHQCRQQVEDLGGCDEIVRADGLRGIDGEPAGEDREPLQEALLRLGEQLIAPVQRRTQGAVARQRRTAAAAEQTEDVVQAPRDLLGGYHPDAGGGQLDRQRDAVEPAADLRDRGAVRLAEAEGGEHGARAVDEELHRLAGGQPLRGELLRVVGERERGHQPGRLARNAERLAAARQQREARAAPQQRIGERGAGVDQVLAVVEHEQKRARLEVLGERLLGITAGLLAQAELLGDLGGQERRVGERGELDPFDPVRVIARDARGDLQREARLAASARAGQGEQARAAEQPAHRGDLALTADEAGELHRQARRGRGARSGTSRAVRRDGDGERQQRGGRGGRRRRHGRGRARRHSDRCAGGSGGHDRRRPFTRRGTQDYESCCCCVSTDSLRYVHRERVDAEPRGLPPYRELELLDRRHRLLRLAAAGAEAPRLPLGREEADRELVFSRCDLLLAQDLERMEALQAVPLARGPPEGRVVRGVVVGVPSLQHLVGTTVELRGVGVATLAQRGEEVEQRPPGISGDGGRGGRGLRRRCSGRARLPRITADRCQRGE